MNSIVIDIGSLKTKIGFADLDEPKSVFPSVVGNAKHPGIMVGMDAKMWYCGNDAMEKRGILGLRYPVQNGVICNFNHWERVIHHGFFEVMDVDPKEHPVLVTENPLNTKRNREKITSILFETFEVPKLLLKDNAVLSLLCNGSTCGVVQDIGHGQSTTTCIYENRKIEHSIQSSNISGRDVTDYLQKLMCERGYEMTTSAERLIVRDIKEKLCFLSLDYDQDMRSQEKISKSFELPDGSNITIEKERFRSTEVLFNPSLIGSEDRGIHEMVHSSIMKCDEQLRKSLLRNIVLAGWSSSFPNLKERLEMEVSKMSSVARPKVSVLAEKGLSSWKGGCVFITLSNKLSEGSWITRQEYEQYGATIVHRKCF